MRENRTSIVQRIRIVHGANVFQRRCATNVDVLFPNFHQRIGLRYFKAGLTPTERAFLDTILWKQRKNARHLFTLKEFYKSGE